VTTSELSAAGFTGDFAVGALPATFPRHTQCSIGGAERASSDRDFAASARIDELALAAFIENEGFGTTSLVPVAEHRTSKEFASGDHEWRELPILVSAAIALNSVSALNVLIKVPQESFAGR
jgi:hypothetical protein